MHVPYSMDDSIPDLYGSYGGEVDESTPQRELLLSPPSPMFSFSSEQELIQSDVFQRCLCKTLEHKDRDIHQLRLEILELNDQVEILLYQTGQLE